MIEQLIQIGFNENEAKVYRAVLALGKPRIAQIVNEAKISKKLCYKALEPLIAEGYVAVEGRRKRVFFVTDVEAIGQRLQERLQAFRHVVPQLYATANEGHTSRSLGIYTDPESIRNIFKRQMRRQQRASTVRAIESAKFHFIDFMNEGRGATFDIYERVRINRAVHLQLLFVDQPGNDLDQLEFEARHLRKRREIRSLPTSIGNTLAGLYIWSGEVLLLTQKPSGGILLIELLNKDIRQGFVAYFESLWNNAKKIL